jgi:uncharacterized protein YegL
MRKIKSLIVVVLLLVIGFDSHSQLKFHNRGSLGAGGAVQVVLLLDISSSMTDKMDELNSGIQKYYSDLASKSILKQQVEFSIITFESNVAIVRQSGLLRNGESAPTLSSSGGTNMTNGLKEAERSLANLSSARKPVVILFSDGLPNDPNEALKIAQRLSQNYHLYVIGVEGADIAYLNQLADSGDVGMLSGSEFNKLFADFSTSLSRYIGTLSRNPKFSMSNDSDWKK